MSRVSLCRCLREADINSSPVHLKPDDLSSGYRSLPVAFGKKKQQQKKPKNLLSLLQPLLIPTRDPSSTHRTEKRAQLAAQAHASTEPISIRSNRRDPNVILPTSGLGVGTSDISSLAPRPSRPLPRPSLHRKATYFERAKSATAMAAVAVQQQARGGGHSSHRYAPAGRRTPPVVAAGNGKQRMTARLAPATAAAFSDKHGHYLVPLGTG